MGANGGTTTISSCEWSMAYSEYFIIYIDVETTGGHRYLYLHTDEYRRSWNWRHTYITVSGPMSWTVSGGRSREICKRIWRRRSLV